MRREIPGSTAPLTVGSTSKERAANERKASVCVRVKICGITNEADALAAAELGADALGLNFYPKSPRCLTEERATSIIRVLPPFVEPVALFVNEPLEHMTAVARRLGAVNVLQFHGADPPLASAAPFRLIPAFPVKDASSLSCIRAYLDRCRAAGQLPSAILLDAHVPGFYGGTGQVAPWDLLADFQPGVPIILAGGLTPENVADAVRRVRPYAVDVASGVEQTPGIKEREKLKRFIDSARQVL